jgi:hypothetical protein
VLICLARLSPGAPSRCEFGLVRSLCARLDSLRGDCDHLQCTHHVRNSVLAWCCDPRDAGDKWRQICTSPAHRTDTHPRLVEDWFGVAIACFSRRHSTESELARTIPTIENTNTARASFQNTCGGEEGGARL